MILQDNDIDPNQAGQSNYSQAMDAAQTGQSDEQPESDKGGQSKTGGPHPQQPDHEGTAADDNSDKKQVNIPGPNEVPDQQKVGE